MEKPYFADRTFTQQDLHTADIPEGEYEACLFSGIDCSGSNLSSRVFIDCVFEQCNLSVSKLSQTAFVNCKFVGCKLLGLSFDHCRPFLFSASFDNCHMNMTSFVGMKLKKTAFTSCIMQEADFTEADLTEADFSGTDLSRAVFESTILEKSDFRTALHFSIDPSRNKIKAARFAANNLEGLLHQFQIHIS